MFAHLFCMMFDLRKSWDFRFVTNKTSMGLLFTSHRQGQRGYFWRSGMTDTQGKRKLFLDKIKRSHIKLWKNVTFKNRLLSLFTARFKNGSMLIHRNRSHHIIMHQSKYYFWTSTKDTIYDYQFQFLIILHWFYLVHWLLNRYHPNVIIDCTIFQMMFPLIKLQIILRMRTGICFYF